MNSYSQNFILKRFLISRLIERTNISQGDLVLDIGAGEGSFTSTLAKKVGANGKVIAIENDRSLIKTLEQNCKGYRNIEVTNEDFLRYQLPKTEFKTFSNIPFNITSEILNKLLSPESKMVSGYIIMQKDAATMYGGTQLDSFTTLKSALIYPFYTISQFHRFRRSDFTPSPRIAIDMIMFSKRGRQLIESRDESKYSTLMKVISKDRVDEGVWKLIFSKEERKSLIKNSSLLANKGIKAQKEENLIKFFLNTLNIKGERWFSEISSEVPKSNNKVKINRTRRDKNWNKPR